MVKNQYKCTVHQWMSDGGGEYKSEAFDSMLREQGIRILQSAPHTPQQNGRAERFMRTMMDKSEAMRHTACIPASWWNFSIEHAVHVYNRTPMRRHDWRTPFEILNGEQPSVERLRVFGCGAWVHIPADVRVNKLAPKSELMTYLGNTDFGWKFMRGPNNVVFTSAHAEFDEEIMPKCDNMGRTRQRERTRAAPPKNNHAPSDNSGDNEDGDEEIRRRSPRTFPKGQGRHLDEGPAAPPRRSPSPPPAAPEEQPEQPIPQPQAQQPAAPLRRSTRERTTVQRPGNVYGESRPPVDIQRDADNLRSWKRTVGLTPGSSSSRPREESNDEQVPGPSSSNTASKNKLAPVVRNRVRVNDLNIPREAVIAKLCQEGGVPMIHYLVSKAISPTEKSHPRDWTYSDILRLPKEEQHEWRQAALDELDAL